MPHIVLERDENTRIPDPSLAVIHDHLHLAAQEVGAPEVTLEFGQRKEGQPVLMLMALFENGVPASGWNVRFRRWRSKESAVSLSNGTAGDHCYRSRIRCGCPVAVRSDCEITDFFLIDSAIRYFMEYGEPASNLKWMAEDDVTADEI